MGAVRFAGAALNRTRAIEPAPIAGHGRLGEKECNAILSYGLAGQLQKFVHGYARHGNAARAVREAHLSDGSGARRKGWQLLQKPHVVKAIIAELRQRKAADARQRASDDWRLGAASRPSTSA